MVSRLLKLAALFLILLVHIPASSPTPVAVTNTRLKAPPAPATFRDLNFDRVRKLVCWSGEGKPKFWGVGTGFVIKENVLVTAAHVIDEQCKDAATGLPARPYYIDWDNDFALIHLDTGPVSDVMEVSCEGFVAGHRYSSIGFAGGSRFRETRLIAKGTYTGQTSKMRYTKDDVVPAIHLANLSGNIYRGQSGGPVINEAGIVVGINSTTNDDGSGGSREIRDTILCGAPRKNPSHLRVPPHAVVKGANVER